MYLDDRHDFREAVGLFSSSHAALVWPEATAAAGKRLVLIRSQIRMSVEKNPSQLQIFFMKFSSKFQDWIQVMKVPKFTRTVSREFDNVGCRMGMKALHGAENIRLNGEIFLVPSIIRLKEFH